MRQTNLKSDKVAKLIEQIMSLTGDSEVETVEKALEKRLQALEAKSNAERTLVWLETSVWKQKGEAPTKKEQLTFQG